MRFSRYIYPALLVLLVLQAFTSQQQAEAQQQQLTPQQQWQQQQQQAQQQWQQWQQQQQQWRQLTPQQQWQQYLKQQEEQYQAHLQRLAQLEQEGQLRRQKQQQEQQAQQERQAQQRVQEQAKQAEAQRQQIETQQRNHEFNRQREAQILQQRQLEQQAQQAASEAWWRNLWHTIKVIFWLAIGAWFIWHWQFFVRWYYQLTPHPAAEMVDAAISDGVELDGDSLYEILRPVPGSNIEKEVREQQAQKLANLARQNNADLARQAEELRKRVREEAAFCAAQQDLYDSIEDQQLARKRVEVLAKIDVFLKRRK